jgi:RHS repeat-associated protein
LSARLVVNASGAVVGRQGHLPYGEEIGTSGEQEKHRFTSYERDSETGTDYAINRFYGTATGRFTTVDPIRDRKKTSNSGSCGNYSNNYYNAGNPQGWSRYTYVLNDSVNKVDPFGLEESSNSRFGLMASKSERLWFKCPGI